MSGKQHKKRNPMMRKDKRSAALGAVAGITVLSGGVEPAGAATLTENEDFFCSVSQSLDFESDNSGTFSEVSSSCMGTAPKFDTLGGTRLLDAVTFSVDGSAESFVAATFSGIEEGGGAGTTDATGVYSFTVDTLALDAVPGPGTTITENAEATCTPSPECETTVSESISPEFGATFTDSGILAGLQMDGGGTFDFMPLIELSGNWDCSGCSSAIPPTGISSEFNGLLEINYEYTVVPAPAALPLLGSGLIALGWLGRRRKSPSE